MASQRLKRSMRGALAASAVVAAVGLTQTPANADPDTSGTASEALQKYNDLSREAEKVAQDLEQAKEDLKAKQADLDKANADLNAATEAENAAKADEEQFRGQVDKLAAASFEGARFNQLSAFLVSDSQQDFLNRMSALGVLAADNKEALDQLSGAVDRADEARRAAEDARNRAQEATDSAAKLVNEISQRKDELDKQSKEANDQYKKLSGAEKESLNDLGDASGISLPPGAVNKAVSFALDQLGDKYVYGATGPDRWDCSSLTQAAWRNGGVSLPRTSRAQSGVGKSVSRSQVQAGDLIFYYSPVSHVALAIDNTRAVHAPTEGVPVKIANIDSIGPITGIRRVGG
ncbi:C40 family peptidase [Goodfellowiella coeruleoviolacea]|uniref:Cell wall-associated hydrolase, NlpC family n=1 Tax=Goodfellowiella coeruleoviolacea TaxID=334858 RepID=A0AAE3GCK4_9PSEU|nr:C40 family peptidase [Goodfellowiella coeruleoviolacea]MCP2165303.1 Cell wall-associated hydrolase, NlpC family [Goodfellowiella coeruleoviolacea]